MYKYERFFLDGILRFLPYGEYPTGDRVTTLTSEATALKNSDYTLDEQIEIIASMKWLTLREQLYMSEIIHS